MANYLIADLGYIHFIYGKSNSNYSLAFAKVFSGVYHVKHVHWRLKEMVKFAGNSKALRSTRMHQINHVCVVKSCLYQNQLRSVLNPEDKIMIDHDFEVSF